MRLKTLSELAALAMVHVPNFARPYVRCACGSASGCRACKGLKAPWNDTPEALFMAVALYSLKVDDRASTIEIDNDELPFIRVSNNNRSGSALVGATPEELARGALVALLGLHGVVEA